jgi:hypothetical protein
VLNTPQKTVSGYFDNPDTLTDAAAGFNRRYNIYITLNAVVPALLARSANRMTPFAGQTTTDDQIARRVWLPIDCDPQRPAGISSSTAEHDAAVQRACECRDYLMGRGVPPNAIVLADSGNGGHLLVRVDLPNTPDVARLAEGFLQALAFHFDDETVTIDTSVANAARIWKVYGTVARKGDDVPERPHRLSGLLDVPDPLSTCPREVVELIAAEVPAQPSAPRLGLVGGTAYDVAGFIGKFLSHLDPREGAWKGGRKWVFGQCFWNAEHRDWSAYIVQFGKGAIAAGCHHNGCSGKGWSDLREMFDPRPVRLLPSPPESPTSSGQPIPGFESGGRADETRILSAAELLAGEDEATDWVVEDRLPAAGSSLVAAPPKFGKSVWCQNLALCVAQGRSFLGLSVKQGTVLFCALEEKLAEYRKHLRAMGLKPGDPLYSYVGRPPENAMEWLEHQVTLHEPVLIIVDTLQRLLRLPDFNDYALVTNRMEPVVHLARQSGAHLLCTTHSRKGGGQHGEAVMGSQAFFASVDTLVEGRRTEQYRTVWTTQRYGPDLAETVVEMDPNTLRVSLAGKRHDVDVGTVSDRIREYLKTLKSDETVEREQIEANVEGRTGLLRDALKHLVETNGVARTGAGKKGDPHHYALPENQGAERGDEPKEPPPHDSCSLVPTTYGEQGNKQPKVLPFSHGDAKNVCSHVPEGELSAGTNNPPVCPYCHEAAGVVDLGNGEYACHDCERPFRVSRGA